MRDRKRERGRGEAREREEKREKRWKTLVSASHVTLACTPPHDTTATTTHSVLDVRRDREDDETKGSEGDSGDGSKEVSAWYDHDGWTEGGGYGGGRG